jgi:TAG lipase/lysophosphatidylethanolamine acyltransferase
MLFIIEALWLFFNRVFTLAAYVLGFTELEHRNRMNAAKTYTEWKGPARLVDNSRGFVTWRASKERRLFNAPEVAGRIDKLRGHVRRGDAKAILEDLQYDFHRAMCGIHNPPLFTTYPSGTMTAVKDLVGTIVACCDVIDRDIHVSRRSKHEVVAHIVRAYGHSALVLNSNAALGAFQVGVVKALNDADVLPNVIFGSGSGALVAAVTCCTDDVTQYYSIDTINFSAFDKRGQRGSLSRKLKRFWTEGTLMDVSVLLQFAKDNLGELTFLEAYEQTGRVLNIHVEKFQPASKRHASWLLNYLTAPDVLVYTAAVASCATYGLYAPVDLLQRMPDGRIVTCEPATLRWSASLEGFHPNEAVERMRSLFNVTNFIVSEASLSRLPFISLEHRGFPWSFLRFFTEEGWRFAAAISRLTPLQSRLTGTLQAYTKPILGDVVVFPVQSVRDMLRLLKNPNQQMMDYCIWRGEHAVWPHIERFKAHVVIEKRLHRLMAKLDPKPR